MAEMIKVLIIEDEASIRKFTKINLDRSGFISYEADTGEEALKLYPEVKPEVVILDIMLPGMNGFDVCEKIRQMDSSVIIIMLTARGQDMDKIMGLELGADDYMVKPFNPLELVARVRASLRRSSTPNKIAERLQSGEIKIDLTSQRCYKNDTEIDLTPTELGILKLFMSNPNKALSRDDILNEIWGRNYFGNIKTVDVHVRRLREKIEQDPSQPIYIETVWGYGYRWSFSEG